MVELRRSGRISTLKKTHFLTEEDSEEVKPAIKKQRVSKTKKIVIKKSNGKMKPKLDGKEEIVKSVKELDSTAVKNTDSIYKELQIGDDIPDIILPDEEGVSVSLKKVVEENKIVVFFAFPKANTPGCTRQASLWVS